MPPPPAMNALTISRRCRNIRVAGAILALVTAFTAPVRAAEMFAQLDRERMYLGTQIRLVVEVHDAASNAWPSVPAIEGLNIQRRGGPSVVRNLLSNQIIYRYEFLVTPTAAGKFTIPEITFADNGATLKRGPLALEVSEAPLRFHAGQIDPPQVLPNETTEMKLQFQGYRPGVTPTVPPIIGLDIRSAGEPRILVTRTEGLPITEFTYRVSATQLGDHLIGGITFEGVPAEPLRLSVAPFVVMGVQVQDDSLVVGGQSTIHILIRGLPDSTALNVVAPPGLSITPSKSRLRQPNRGALFSFEVTANEPGNPTIDTVELPDGTRIRLPEPIAFSIRQSGEGGILACRGLPRTEETVVGEPFIVDFEFFYRGDFRGAGIDLRSADFANQGHIKVEPVEDLSYADWPGRRIEIGLVHENRETRAIALAGNGELNGQKEQMLRFALRITPLAAGDLSLDGVNVIVALQITEQRRTGMSFFSSSSTQQYARKAEVPPHRVLDPPGVAAPAGYRGAVGASLSFVTGLDRTTAAAMSPLTLTLTITGDSVGKNFQPPLLAELPELIRDFDVSPIIGGGEVKDRAITFTQIIRPRSEKVKQVPALPIVFYNYQKKKYETVYSLPIPIEVTPGGLVGAEAMTVATTVEPVAQTRPDATAVGTDVLVGANYAELGRVITTRPLAPATVLLILIAGPAVVTVAWAGRQIYRKSRPGAEVRRQRKELFVRLDNIDSREDVYGHLARVFQEYLRLRFGLPQGELSPHLVVEKLKGLSDAERLTRQTRELLDVFDAGRFATGPIDASQRNELVERTRQLMRELEEA